MTVTSPNRVYLASLCFAQIPRLRLETSDTLKTLYIQYLKQDTKNKTSTHPTTIVDASDFQSERGAVGADVTYTFIKMYQKLFYFIT
jgi:hypothetical protein